jgi:hypothetical protein
MAIPRVIYGLAKKRAELVAELEHPSGRHVYCRSGIAAIDAVYPLWDVEPPVYRKQFIPNPALVPKLSRAIIVALREAQPLTVAEIVQAVSDGREWDKAERHKLTQTVMWRLKEMRKAGRVQHADIVGSRIRWALAD